MPRATRIQERCSRRAVAALAAAVLILVAWLGARHEAEVAHVIDQNGVAVHAQKVADHHEESAGAHLHGREAHDDHAPGACALLATAHAAALAPRSPAALPLAAITEALGAPPPTVVRAAIAGYRLAPKTSPPAHG